MKKFTETNAEFVELFFRHNRSSFISSTEYDRRRNVKFLETFPEMENFWNLCKQTVEDKKENSIPVTQLI